MERIGSVLFSALKDLNIEERVAFESLRQRWHTLFHEPLSLHISPIAFRDGELVINVDSPAWLQQVKFLKKEILERLGDLQVKDIRFRHGKVYGAFRQVPAGRGGAVTREAGELPESDALWIDETLSTIVDADLKESLKKTIGKAIRQPTRR